MNRVDRAKSIKLSYAQERLLAIEAVYPGSQALNTSAIWKVQGALDLDALSLALSDLVRRHEVLRTWYSRNETGSFDAIIDEADKFTLTIRRVSLSDEDVRANARLAASKSIDIFRKPPFNVVVFVANDETTYVVFNAHHIATDHVSDAIVWREISEAYNAIVQGHDSRKEAPSLQYADYAAWERNRLTPQRKRKLAQFWRNELAGAPTCINLPFDRPRPPAPSDLAESVVYEFGDDVVTKLRSFCADHNLTPFIVLETTLAILCGFLAGCDDVVLGSASQQRRHFATADMLGMFVNTIPLRHRIRSGESVIEHLRRARDKLLASLMRDELPFDEIVAALAPKRYLAFDPLFQIFCQLRVVDDLSPLKLGDLSIEPIPIGIVGRGADLALVFDISDRRLTATLTSSSDLFDRATTETMMTIYRLLLVAVVEQADFSVEQVWSSVIAMAYREIPAKVAFRLFDEPLTETGAWYPLTSIQESVWLSEQKAPAGSSFDSLAILRCPAFLDLDRLQSAISGVVHQMQVGWLRISDQGLQGAAKRPTATIDRFAMEPIGNAGDDGLIDIRRWHQSFEKGRGGFAIFSSPDECVVAVSSPHFFNDGWSAVISLQRVLENYERLTTYPDTKFERTRFFLPAVREDQLYRWSADGVEDFAYWRQELGKSFGPPPIAILADRPSSQRKMEVASHRLVLRDDLAMKLRDLARDLSISLSELVFGLTALYLSRAINEEQIIVSAPFLNRSRDFLRVPGQFAKIVPVRLEFAGDLSIRDCLLDAAVRMRAALTHGRYPTLDLARRLDLDLEYTECSINSLFVSKGFSVEGGPARMQWLSGPETGFSVLFTQFGRDAPIEIEWRYNIARFDETSIQRHAERLLYFIGECLGQIEAYSGDISLLSASERDLVTRQFNVTEHEISLQKSIVDHFSDRAKGQPNAIAVMEGDQLLTYDELDAASNRLARHLMGIGIGSERVVGVCMARSTNLIVTLLAIWKAGGAYLPLDPDYTLERLAYMLADANAAAIVSQQEFVACIADAEHVGNVGLSTPYEHTRKLVLLDDPDTQASLARLPSDPIAPSERCTPLKADDLAYVLYTSGSTGKPKGVMIEQGSVLNRLTWMQSYRGLTPSDVILQKTPATFDVSVWELFWWAMYGAKVAILGSGEQKDPAAVLHAIQRYGVTTLHFVPSMFTAFLQVLSAAECLKNFTVKRIFTSGEALPSSSVKALSEITARHQIEIELINLYGPTEATVDVTAYVTHADDCVVPIGSPVWNTQVYVVDQYLKPQPIGMAGELLIGGMQVARGYLNRSELTAEKFIADPFGSAPGARLYRSGDLARWRSDGLLEYLGRIDTQVKIRGMRVELGEIEAALTGLPGIAEACVQARKEADGDLRLVAYLVPATLPEKLKVLAILSMLADAADEFRPALNALERAMRCGSAVPGIVDQQLEQGSDERQAWMKYCQQLEAALASQDRSALAELLLVAPELLSAVDDAVVGAVSSEALIVELDGLVDLEAVRTQLKRTLPEHMIPAAFVGLFKMPSTSSGKIDRKALPKAKVSFARSAYLAPRNEMEVIVTEEIAALLGLERVGVDDSFFDLGGHSLLAARLIARLESRAGKTLRLRSVFESPKASELAALLNEAEVAYQPLVRFPELKRGGRQALQRKIYCIHEISGHAIKYGQPAFREPLWPQAEVIGIEAPARGQRGFANYDEMIATYMSAISNDSVGAPKALLGWSFGGYVGHDLASRLAAADLLVDGLVILDSVISKAGFPAMNLEGQNFREWVEEAAKKSARPTVSQPAQEVEQKKIDVVTNLFQEIGSIYGLNMENDRPFVEELLKALYDNSLLLDQRAKPLFFPGRVLIVRAADTKEAVDDPTLGWRSYCGSIDSIDVPFKHLELLKPEAAGAISGIVRDWFDRVGWA